MSNDFPSTSGLLRFIAPWVSSPILDKVPPYRCLKGYNAALNQGLSGAIGLEGAMKQIACLALCALALVGSVSAAEEPPTNLLNPQPTIPPQPTPIADAVKLCVGVVHDELGSILGWDFDAYYDPSNDIVHTIASQKQFFTFDKCMAEHGFDQVPAAGH